MNGWCTRPEILAAIRRLVNRKEVAPSLLPVLRWPVVHDAEVLAIVLHGWPTVDASQQRLQAIEALLGRPALVDVAEPREQVMEVLRRARHRSFRRGARPDVARHQRPARALGRERFDQAALVGPGRRHARLRRLGLTLADSKPGFWSRPDALEYLKRLLVDPDAQVRARPWSTVEQHGLIGFRPLSGPTGQVADRRPGAERPGPDPARRARRRSRHGRAPTSV